MLRGPLLRSVRAGLGLGLLTGALAGCGLLNTAAEAPGRLVSAFTPNAPAPKIDAGLLAQRLMRFSDLFAYEVRHASEDFARAAGTPEALIQGLEWRVEYTTAAFKRATVAQPYAGVFDLLMLVTAMHSLHVDRYQVQWGEPNQILVAALKRLEDAVWKLAEEAMTPEQLADTRLILQEWLAGDPDARVADAGRLPEIGDVLARRSGAAGLVSGVTDLVRIDPLSGLEPATREFAQIRALGERLFFYAQRLPDLMEARVRLAGLRTAHADQTQEFLAGWERATHSLESVAATAAALPAQVSAERETALAQLSAELERQREGLVRDLEQAQAPLTELLGETRTAVESTRALSDSLQLTFPALGTFLDRFEKDEAADAEAESAAPAAPAAEAAEAASGARPFDITEYGVAAERIGAAVHELNATLAELERNLPALQRALDETAARGERTVDHVFRRALVLVLVALAGGVVAVLLVRALSARRARATG
jgi:hypothetical protein